MPVLYGQIVAFSSELSNPYNDWDDGHISQGFSWRPESVSFSIPSEIAVLDLHIELDNFEKIERRCIRVIKVPIILGITKKIEVGNILNTLDFEMKYDKCTVTFQLLYGISNGKSEAKISICAGYCEPQIIIADKELNPPSELHLIAFPAR
jgi:hypothetical protein